MLRKIRSTIFTKGLIAFINLALLLITSKYLGGSIVGQISLVVLNISIIQIINEIYTGYALVYFIPKFSLKKTYTNGLIWTLFCVALSSIVFLIFKIGLPEFWLHSTLLSLILILHSFHMVILLAKEKIRIYNALMLLQVLILLLLLSINVFVRQQHTIYSYIFAMYGAYGSVLLLSTYRVSRLLKDDIISEHLHYLEVVKKGLTNQLGNLAHTLSNRFNYYIIGSSLLIGVYANSTSLIESVWIIGGSAAPIVLSHIANSGETKENARLALRIARLCFVLSACCVLLLFFIPNAWFVYFLGSDFADTKQFMLYLSPGILAISFSTIISHYFSGIGQQRVQLGANLAGLCCTLLLSAFMIARFGLKGACLTASLSYFVQAFILFVVFIKTQGVGLKTLWTYRA